MSGHAGRAQPSTAQTILDALLASLGEAAAYNRSTQVAPAVVLWPDHGKQWAPLVPALRAMLPQLLTLGGYDPAARTGPATWIKCMIARTLPEADWAEDVVPILYLPGVSRFDLRAVESCPKHLQPLAELQYRGVFWTQQNGRDWSVLAFLKGNSGGLGLDVAQDAKTLEAMSRALVQLADTPVASLRGRRLEASDFDHLLTTDPVRDILRWLNDPEGTKNRWGPGVWGAFRSVCKADFGFDPETDGELTGAEKLAGKEGKWERVWARFAESPRLYPNLPALLRKAEPSYQQDLFADRSPWPGANEKDEESLRSELAAMASMPAREACEKLRQLEELHRPRRSWVWADLGMSPLALAMRHLGELAQIAAEAVGGATPADMGGAYMERAWRADAAVWQALACVERKADVPAVTAAVRAVYRPWVEAAAERLQSLVAKQGFPGQPGSGKTKALKPAKGECLFFADGLRFDVGQALREELEANGMEVTVSSRWQGLPSVTGTCKPAVSPIADQITGRADDGQFLPSLAETGESLATHRFRKLLEEAGVQVLGKEETGDPKGKGWCEHGDLDHAGHQEGAKLARRIDEQVRELRERIADLLDAGWKRVRVVTDHGWLLLPGGLPKVELPSYLAETRWGRCAILKDTAAPTDLVVPWCWSADIRVALPPGISSFKANKEYSHGGLSLQECLTPELVVMRPGGGAADVTISEVTWRGLRCRVLVAGACSGLRVDLRTKPAVADSSLAGGGKAVGDDGKVSLVVEDDSAEGMVAVVVVISSGGAVVSKTTTTVGGEN